MSAVNDCCSPCSTIPPVNIPGTPGTAGTPGTNGADGQNAFSFLTAISPAIPAIGSSIALSVANNQFLLVGQNFLVSSTTTTGGASVGVANFKVVSFTGTNVITATYLGYSGDLAPGNLLASGSGVSPSGISPAATSLAGITALTDNDTDATVSNILAIGVGIDTIALFVNLVDIAAADILTTYTPGYAFKILEIDFVTLHVPAAGKAATLTPKISGAALTGGALVLTSAACNTQGAVVASSAPITAGNVGTASNTISITGSLPGAVPFTDGSGWILLRVKNLDTANAMSSIAAKVNAIKAAFP